MNDISHSTWYTCFEDGFYVAVLVIFLFIGVGAVVFETRSTAESGQAEYVSQIWNFPLTADPFRELFNHQ